mgnify:FL=1
MHLPAERRIFRKSHQFGRCVFFIDFGRVPCYTHSGMFPAGGNWPCRAQVSIAAGRGLPLTSAMRAAILPSEEFPCVSLVVRRPAAVVGSSLLTFEAEIGILLSEGFGEVTPECISAEKGVLLTTFFFFARRLLPAFSVPLHFPLQFLHDLPPFRRHPALRIGCLLILRTVRRCTPLVRPSLDFLLVLPRDTVRIYRTGPRAPVRLLAGAAHNRQPVLHFRLYIPPL